ncbi:MAG: dTMP kinase [Gemmatimonadota bacterium]
MPERFGAPSPLFLVLEGGEGAGKTTQVERLATWLRHRAWGVTTAREPGGTQVGESIRSLLLQGDDVHIPPRSELFLMLAARAAFVDEVVAPALQRGEMVLADRFDLSTFAYQGFGRGLPLPEVREANRLAVGAVVPDLYLVLDVPVAVGQERQRAEGKGLDRMEREGAAFLETVGKGYWELTASEPRACRIPAGGSPDDVHLRIVQALEERFPETFPTGKG